MKKTTQILAAALSVALSGCGGANNGGNGNAGNTAAGTSADTVETGRAPSLQQPIPEPQGSELDWDKAASLMREIVAKLPTKKNVDDWHPKDWSIVLEEKYGRPNVAMKQDYVNDEGLYTLHIVAVFPKKDGTFLVCAQLESGYDGSYMVGEDTFTYNADTKQLTPCERPMDKYTRQDFFPDPLLLTSVTDEAINNVMKDESNFNSSFISIPDMEDGNRIANGLALILGDYEISEEAFVPTVKYLWNGEKFVKTDPDPYFACIYDYGFSGLRFSREIPKSVKGYTVEHNNPNPESECVDYVIKKNGKKVLELTPTFDIEKGGELDELWYIKCYSPDYGSEFANPGSSVAELVKKLKYNKIDYRTVRTEFGEFIIQTDRDNIQYWYTPDDLPDEQTKATITAISVHYAD